MQRREFDHLGRIHRSGTNVRRVQRAEIGSLLAFAGREIPVLSSAEKVVAKVINRNADSIWVFERGDSAVGIYAMLHLSRDGLEALLLGELNAGDPDPCTLVPTGGTPAAIYKWAVVAPGPAIAGVCAMSRLLQADTFASANLYARPTTPQARPLMAHLGFHDVRSGCPGLQRYVRIANRSGGLVGDR
ncbi:hypothetical protein [Microbaculum marinum]|uniref:N-acetyltransferase n=1 Tax=Microbaculum marinum TaxID=1764581 RepID=A0AAW9RNG0_9HYPH